MRLPIAHFFRTKILPSGLHNDACEAIITCCTLTQVRWSTAKLGVPAQDVVRATENFLRASARAFGTDGALWKHHAILHHPAYVAKWGRSPRMLPLEGKHKSVLKVWRRPPKGHNVRDPRSCSREFFFNLRDAKWLYLDAGLAAPTAPAKKLSKLLADAFGAADDRASGKARFNEFDVAWVRGAVALRSNDGWIAARAFVGFDVERAMRCRPALQAFGYASVAQRVGDIWRTHVG